MPIDELACPSHRTQVDWEDGNTARVALDPAETTAATGTTSCATAWRASRCRPACCSIPARQDENFFLLMVQPPRRVSPAQIPPREYIFVLDVSGSMHGFPLDTAKTLMRELIGGLRPTDSFNVILFSGGSRLLAPQSLPATAGERQPGDRRDRPRAGRRRRPSSARRSTRRWRCRETAGVSRTTIVVTDGYVDAEGERLRADPDPPRTVQPVRLRHRQLGEPPPDRRDGARRPGRAVRRHRARPRRRPRPGGFQDVRAVAGAHRRRGRRGRISRSTTSSRCRSRTCSPTARWSIFGKWRGEATRHDPRHRRGWRGEL